MSAYKLYRQTLYLLFILSDTKTVFQQFGQFWHCPETHTAQMRWLGIMKSEFLFFFSPSLPCPMHKITTHEIGSMVAYKAQGQQGEDKGKQDRDPTVT